MLAMNWLRAVERAQMPPEVADEQAERNARVTRLVQQAHAAVLLSRIKMLRPRRITIERDPA